MQDEQQAPAQDAAQPPKENEAQIATQFLHFFPKEVANIILANLPVDNVKSISFVSKTHHACTSHFFATAMARFWRPERVKTANPVSFRYHYSCAAYYAACSDARKSKALMRFFSMLISDLMSHYGKRLAQCVTFNREELPERLGLNCKNKHLLLDISDYLLEKFNFNLEFFDRDDTTHAVVTHEQIERQCATMLFQYIVYDFLKPADLSKISTRFLDTLFATELKIVNQHGWEMFRPRIYACSSDHAQLCSGQSIDTLETFLHTKLRYLSDDRPHLLRVRNGDITFLDIELRHFESQPGFFTAALKFIQPLIKRVMFENIPPDAVEKTLETNFEAYEKPAPEKPEKCSLM